MKKYYYNSPIGIMEIICTENTLYSLKIIDKFDVSDKETDFSRNIKTQLEEYFLGKRKNFDININIQGTDFQKQVWQELQKIPFGKTQSYSEIAQLVGRKNAQRAVGSACNKNPIMIIIPCHRIISKNGNIGGFAYGNFIKQKLLELENHTDSNTPLYLDTI